MTRFGPRRIRPLESQIVQRKRLAPKLVPFVGSTEAAKDVVARFGVIDRCIRKATSRLHASVCACHHLLVNVYRSQLASVSSDRRTQGLASACSARRGKESRARRSTEPNI